MVEIEPLKGYTYNLEKVGNISNVISPPWDVIDSEYEKKLKLLSPYNVINLISKNENPQEVFQKFNKWIKEKIVIEDESDCFYFMKHTFLVDNKQMERNGVFALLKLETFEKGNIIPHERIFEKYKVNRYKLIEKCRANFSPVFMLYQDNNFIFENEIKKLNGEIKGTINNEIFSFGKIKDKNKIEIIKNIFKDKKLIIADGHHRYNAALHFYLDNPTPSAGKVLVFLVNIESPDLLILPTHRYVIEDISFFKKKQLIEKFFEIQKVPSLFEMIKKMEQFQDSHCFGVYDNGEFFVLILKEKEIIKKIAEKHSENWSELDTVILHEFIFPEIFEIKNNEFFFHISPEYLIKEREKRKKGIIFFLNPIKKEQFLKICFCGEVMPQKSTYFYPKVPSGLVIYKFNS